MSADGVFPECDNPSEDEHQYWAVNDRSFKKERELDGRMIDDSCTRRLAYSHFKGATGSVIYMYYNESY